MEKTIQNVLTFGKTLSQKCFKNKFTSTFLLFILWIAFIDNNNLYRQVNRYLQIHKLNNDLIYYKQQLITTNHEYKAMNENQYYFEKFVREKYLLKKDNEDIFVFSEQK